MAYQRNGYYYRSRREGGRVVTEYLGAGELAELIAELDQAERAEREAARATYKAAKDRERELDADLGAVGDVIGALTKATLILNDYHTHKGKWRRRRNVKRRSNGYGPTTQGRGKANRPGKTM